MKFSGRKLKALIHSKGLKSNYIAQQIGITPNYFSTILNGKRNPGIKVMEALCDILDCSISEFFLGRE